MTQPSSQLNKRRARRQPARGTIKLRCYANALGLGRNVGVQVMDLSEVGIRLTVRQELKPGQEIEITLESIALVRPLTRVANVIWVTPEQEGVFLVGAQFQKPLPYGDWQAMVKT